MEGILKQEKKCPKCKSINMLLLSENEIRIQCDNKLTENNLNNTTVNIKTKT
jgi:phage FluMu protein Com